MGWHRTAQHGALVSLLFFKQRASSKRSQTQVGYLTGQPHWGKMPMMRKRENPRHRLKLELQLYKKMRAGKKMCCYLARTLDASSLVLIRHDFVNSKGFGDGEKAWHFFQQRFRSDKTTTVISLMRQLAKQIWEDKVIYQYFIRAQTVWRKPGNFSSNVLEVTRQLLS